MPDKICEKCAERMKSFVAFQRQFEIMDEFFRERLNSLRQRNASPTSSYQYLLHNYGKALRVYRIIHPDGSISYDERPCSEPSPGKPGPSSQNSSGLPLSRYTNQFLVQFYIKTNAKICQLNNELLANRGN